MGGTARRVTLSQMFVELPSSRTLLKHLPHVSSAGHKENALSRSSTSQMNSSTDPAPVNNKRKLDVEPPALDEPSTKKHKQPIPPNATDEYPNGFVYCHQCNKKRDATGLFHFLPQSMYLLHPQSLSAAPQKTARVAGATPSTASLASRIATVLLSRTSSQMEKQTRITMSTERVITSGNHSVHPAGCHRSRTCRQVPTMR